jgi:hypothetical protein
MDDHVALIARVVARNPVPDIDDPPAGMLGQEVVRRSVMRRETNMKTEERLIEAPSEPRRRGVWVAAVAFATVVLVGVAIALVGGGEPDEGVPVDGATTLATTTEAPTTTATEAPTTTATTAAPAELTDEAMVAIVEDFVGVHNSGDFVAWQSLFGDRPSVFGEPMITDADWDFQRSFFAANEQWTLTGDCILRPNSKVECPAELRNDFMGPAGLFFVVPQLDVTLDSEGEVISIGGTRWDIRGVPEDYFAAFDAWLAEIHPDIHASFGDRVGDPVTGDDWGALPSAADMATALEYVDEFLAQSDVYPLTE